MKQINTRLVLHFPGFEPLDAQAHQQRYARSAAQASKVWAADFAVKPLVQSDGGARFDVEARAEAWQVRSTIHVFDHNDLIAEMRSEPLWRQLLSGYCAAVHVVVQGGALGYLRHAWRFGLFFLFPFLFVGLAMALSLAIAALPVLFGLSYWLFGLSVPAAVGFFAFLFVPYSNRFHTLHLFADWRLAVAVAREDDSVRLWVEKSADDILQALKQNADEVLITAHSMGASLAIAAIGRVLEKEPDAFAARDVTFVTLGGAALQCALLSSATTLRRRVGVLARNRDVLWFDIQCLTDPIHLYRCHTVALCGHEDARQPKLVFIRFKHALSPERYKKNRRDLLRMHRQYILGPDRKSGFDFTLMTAGPLPAASFVDLKSDQPPVF